MKAISLWQPWASLIACGAKAFETRSWPPPPALIGQTIAIHAARKVDREAARFATDLVFGQHRPIHADEMGGFDLADRLAATWSRASDDVMGAFGDCVMPAGCVVATARLNAAFQCGRPVETPDGRPAAAVATRILSGLSGLAVKAIPLDSFGDYGAGRWAWLLADIRPINPPPSVKGAQGFFELPQGWLVP